MTIREQFQDDVNEFIDDLTTFATGSYLNEDDKELWDEPFDPAVLPDLKRLMEMYLDTLDLVDADPGAEKLNAVVEPFFTNLHEFNAQHADAVLEPEEKADLQDFAYRAAAATGATEEALNSLPELE
ncbi:hypothetical protein CJ203_01640 [Corynebacterium tuscaniense]|uniref:Uncharacterized protein n=1 Tax=Corynebacterium tuscaniense TaxID=302449 RepID=A0A2N6T752_9CORY|nr:hypothetical protein [Corynebacterium tuscaniense]KGF23777.1 hypothetical protein HMPREF2129_03770 [Corynebacterium tuscaniense DNF00037]PMC65150.1 hypothetical protein CJ203_01640 [Corynebacterium tuscaniense]